MPVSVSTDSRDTCITLRGVVSIEELDDLIAIVRQNPGMPLDLSECEHLHTAALQFLMLESPPLAALPEDPFWSNFLTDQWRCLK